MTYISILGAVSEITRFKLLEIIGKKEICACVPPKMLGVSQSAVSQHLKVLKNASLVSVRKSGAKRIYSLSVKGRKVLKSVKSW